MTWIDEDVIGQLEQAVQRVIERAGLRLGVPGNVEIRSAHVADEQ